MENKDGKKLGAIAVAIPLALSLGSPLAISGCAFFGGGEQQQSVGTGNVNKGKNENVSILEETSYDLELGAENSMVNGGLKFSLIDVQRRPMSTFAGSDMSKAASSGTNDRSVSPMATDSIVIQMDVSYTWNVNAYTAAVQKATGSTPRSPSALKALLTPGTLMYIEGVDDDGNRYISGDVIEPEEQDDVNQLAINAQWDYSILSSSLPETSVRKSGSILMRVASTAKDLKLIIYTPTGGQDISDTEAVAMGEVDKYVFPLS